MKFINPNLHVILIHYPLALLTLGLVIEIFSFLWRKSSFRTAGRWMILLGTLATIPAATSGIFALRDVAAHGAEGNELHWLRTKQEANLSATQWEMLHDHILFSAIAAGIALVTVITWIACSDKWRARLYVPGIVLMVLAIGFVTAGAWHGGEMVYQDQVAVRSREEMLKPPPVEKTDLTAADKREAKIQEYLTPMQMHVIMAGLVFAIAAAALGLSIRATVVAHALVVQQMPTDVAAANLGAESQSRPISVQPMPGDSSMSTVVSAVLPYVPSARFWVFAAVVALITILGGFYVGDYFKDPSKFGHKLALHTSHYLFSKDGADLRRQGAHIILGSSILILTLVLGIIARWAPRSRALLATFSSLLVLVMAGQLLMGILLLYDTGHGPISGFEAPAIEAKK